MPQCPVGEGCRHKDLGLDFSWHLKRARQPHQGTALACTRIRSGRLMVLLDHRALRDQADLAHREETRGHREELADHREETRGRLEDLADRREVARGHQDSREEEVQVDVPRPWDRPEVTGWAEVAEGEDQEVRRVVHHPHRRHTQLDSTQIGEKWSTENSFAFT